MRTMGFITTYAIIVIHYYTYPTSQAPQWCPHMAQWPGQYSACPLLDAASCKVTSVSVVHEPYHCAVPVLYI